MYNVELKMVEKEFGSDHIGMYYPLNNIASVLKKMQGKYEDALNIYTEAMAIGEKELECNALDVTLVEHNMGHVYRLQREYDKTIDALNRALAIRKEKLGLDHVHTADTLGNIASRALRAQEKHQEAMEKYQQLMPFYMKEYGSNSVKVAALLNSIALTLERHSKYEDAMAKYKRCLDIAERILGMNHHLTVSQHTQQH
uniref:Kinesin light chain n=1 Tax=Chaetoceros debilis TaxID=122233 RepID=A0A7S3QGR6_9STRA